MTDTNRNADQRGPASSKSEDLRQRAITAYDSAREKTSDAARRAEDSIGESPLVALGAGIAVGALVAALLPTSRREREVLAPYAKRATGAARDAADAAREAGSQKLRELGLTPDAVAEKATEAARATAQAAVGRLKDEAPSKN